MVAKPFVAIWLTRWYSMANHQSACLCRKNAFLKNVVCDLNFLIHDLENVIGVKWTGNE